MSTLAYSQSVLLRLSCHECAKLPHTSLCMTDVWHLKSSRTSSWIEPGQISAITQVSQGIMGTKGHSLSACLLGAPAWACALGLLLHGKADSWLTSRVLHRLEVPADASQRTRVEAPSELHHSECDESLGSLAEDAAQQSGLCVRCQAPGKPPCHFPLGQTCPAGTMWKSTSSACRIRKPDPPQSCFCTSRFPSLPHFHSICHVLFACEWLLTWSVYSWTPIYQLRTAYIDPLGDSVL